jgi:HD-GYP domain-containing protein (c-di-GMP phosphodiesterase class II)
MFHPKVLAAFDRLANTEAFWVEAISPSLSAIVSKKVLFQKEIIDLGTLRAFAKVFAHLIDFRCRFTATHSSGVAAVALELSAIDGFSERECRLMEIAGFLHDIGKLTVPNSILEKNGTLDADEILCIRKHTYYTHAILSKIGGLGQIATLASQHHEKLNGNGYPFHIQGKNISKLSRIVAVADIVTALTENRPYRSGMGRKKVMKTLRSMAASGGIDGKIVALVNKNFPRINEARVKAQTEALQEYKAFHNNANDYRSRQRPASHNLKTTAERKRGKQQEISSRCLCGLTHEHPGSAGN